MTELRTVHRLGFRPSLPDQRDLIADTATLPTLPEVDPRKEMTPVYDQFRLGSCTANAVAAALDYDRIVSGEEPFFPSRLGIYFWERRIEGQPAGQDTGAMGRDGFKAARGIGYWAEKDWPYVGEEDRPEVEPRFHEDPAATLGPAPQHLTHDYRQVPRSIAAFKQVLSNRQTVAIGFSVYESFQTEEVARSGIMPMPEHGETLDGGHEVLVVGYLQSEPNHALVRNSWSPRWGLDGYFLMPWAVLMSAHLSSDFRTIRRPV